MRERGRKRHQMIPDMIPSIFFFVRCMLLRSKPREVALWSAASARVPAFPLSYASGRDRRKKNTCNIRRNLRANLAIVSRICEIVQKLRDFIRAGDRSSIFTAVLLFLKVI